LHANGGGGSGNTVTEIYHNTTYLNSGQVMSTANTRYNIALMKSSGTTLLYLNGATTGSISGSTPGTPVGNLTIGVITGVLRYHGSIDEVKIYNTALTAAQVQNEFLATQVQKPGSGNAISFDGVEWVVKYVGWH